jgi:endoglucanase
LPNPVLFLEPSWSAAASVSGMHAIPTVLLTSVLLLGCATGTVPRGDTGEEGSPAVGAPSEGAGGDSPVAGGGADPLPELMIDEAPAMEGDPITAVEAAAEMGRGFNLGQMFENTQHPRTFEAARAKIDAYYERGFRNVRIPITWTEPVGGDLLVKDPAVGDVDLSNPRLGVIAQVIDYALSKSGLYVVINAHHERALKTEVRSAVLERLWQDIVSIFGARTGHLLFEVLNEPHADDDTPMAPEQLRLMTGLAYEKIREVNPARIVLIGGNQWFGASEVPAVWTSLDEVGGGADPYVMATFHHYNPWTFCGDNQGDYADPWTDADIAEPMNTMQDWADSVGQGMPVFIGEWGVGWQSVLSTMDCNNIRSWYAQFDSQNAEPLGQPTAVWDDGGWFRIFDHGAGQFENNLIDCIAGECDWTGTERFNAACGG